MQKQDIINSINSPSQLTNFQVKELKQLIDDYPYCQILHLMYVSKLQTEKSALLTNQISVASAYVSDRSRLYSLLNSDAIPKETITEIIAPVVLQEPVLAEKKEEFLEPVVEVSDIKQAEISVTIESEPVVVKETPVYHRKPILDYYEEREKSLSRNIDDSLDADGLPILKPKQIPIKEEDRIEAIESEVLQKDEPPKSVEQSKVIVTSPIVVEPKKSLFTEFDEGNELNELPVLQPKSLITPKETPSTTITTAEEILRNRLAELSKKSEIQTPSIQTQPIVEPIIKIDIPVEETDVTDITELEKEYKSQQSTYVLPELEETDVVKQPEIIISKIDLINKFIKDKPTLAKPQKTFFDPHQKALESVEDNSILVTETLAQVYLKQGNLKRAIDTYEKLSLIFPKKRPYFALQIENIKQQQAS